VCGTLLKKIFRQPVDESMNVFKRESGVMVVYGGSSGVVADYP